MNAGAAGAGGRRSVGVNIGPRAKGAPKPMERSSIDRSSKEEILACGGPLAAGAAPALDDWRAQPPLPLPTPSPMARSAWPAATPSQAEAAEALSRAIAGTLPAGAALGAVAEQVLVSLSALEREVLGGDPQPFDPAPVRAAAVMRLRVAAAVATAPPPGAPVDRDAVQGLLGEIDALLPEVKALVQGAPRDARLGLEAVRNALVREAIAFSEAAGGGAPAPAPAATPAPRRAAATRVLAPAETTRRRAPIGLLVLLTAVAAGALGYHGWRLHLRPAPVPPASFPGAPEGTLGVDRGASRLLTTLPGRRVDPAELERFRRLEASRGNVLRAVSAGTWVIEPAPAPAETAR